MASQPTFAPYTPLRNAALKPNIRIAYIAGDASIAIHRGMAAEPAAKRESTLEELAIAGLTEELIAAGRELLSPAMYAAFLRWGETASHLNTHYTSDAEGSARCDVLLKAVADIAALAAGNMHDVLFKARLVNLEAGDCPDFGPISGHGADGKRLPALINGLGNDLAQLSPFITLLDQLATTAWGYSPADLNAITPAIGSIITQAFSMARGELDLDGSAPAILPSDIDGYSPFMRGPLVAWRKAYAVYEAAAADLSAYERDIYNPVADRYVGIRGDSRKPVTPEMDELLAEVPMDEVQKRFDDLVIAKHDASERLWLLPAPSAAELAVKLTIFNDRDGWELCCVPEVMKQLAFDARRLGRHGTFLQADEALLAAYAGCRREMEGAFQGDAMSRVEEDAYFARLDVFEMTLFDAPAMTLEGVLAKLRVAYSRLNPEAWSDHAIVNPCAPAFQDGMRMSGLFEQIMWAAIEDLARIGGVNLAEQGA